MGALSWCRYSCPRSSIRRYLQCRRNRRRGRQPAARKSGRVVHYAGDAVLAEFDSVLLETRCATGMQWVIQANSLRYLEERRLLLRIDLNLADVIIVRNDILGDGVNITQASSHGRTLFGQCAFSTFRSTQQIWTALRRTRLAGFPHTQELLGLGRWTRPPWNLSIDSCPQSCFCRFEAGRLRHVRQVTKAVFSMYWKGRPDCWRAYPSHAPAHRWCGRAGEVARTACSSSARHFRAAR